MGEALIVNTTLTELNLWSDDGTWNDDNNDGMKQWNEQTTRLEMKER